jgi:DNA-directed RNA polymerase specialized sigma24 family protein
MKQNLVTLREDELLALIKSRKIAPAEAERAWMELYSRHVRFIYSQVQSAGSLVGRPISVEDVVERVFQQVWLGAADRFQSGHYDNPDDARRHVLAWLGKIAVCEFKQALASRGNEFLVVREPTKFVNQESSTRDVVCTDEAAFIKGIAEDVLSADELEIVWLKMQYYDPCLGDSRVSPDDLSAICAHQHITKEVFRKRYERAIAKIREAISCVETASQND